MDLDELKNKIPSNSSKAIDVFLKERNLNNYSLLPECMYVMRKHIKEIGFCFESDPNFAKGEFK